MPQLTPEEVCALLVKAAKPALEVLEEGNGDYEEEAFELRIALLHAERFLQQGD